MSESWIPDFRPAQPAHPLEEEGSLPAGSPGLQPLAPHSREAHTHPGTKGQEGLPVLAPRGLTSQAAATLLPAPIPVQQA